MTPESNPLKDQFGAIDIYLFDQLLKGRVPAGGRVLDAACGAGRNCHYLLAAGFDVHGVDAEPDAIAAIRRLASRLRPDLPADRFRVERLEAMSVPDEYFDLVVANAVLHFATDDELFLTMLEACWRAVKTDGLLFCRLASSIGIEDRVRRVEGRIHELPDGSTRYLVDESMLLELTHRLGGELADPIKTTVVQGLRAMTTWVLRRREN